MLQKSSDNNKMRTTIREQVKIEGLNVFTGKKNSATIFPYSGQGLTFYQKGEYIPASLENAFEHRPPRSLGLARLIALMENNETIKKVEHFLAPFYALGIDDAVIELSDGVCPRLDYCTFPTVEAIKDLRVEKPNQQRKYLRVKPGLSQEQRTFKEGKAELIVQESNNSFVEYSVDLPHKAIGKQKLKVNLNERGFTEQIMKARGCFFLPLGSRFMLDIWPFKGRHGITDKNSLLVGKVKDENYLNTEHPRGIYGKDDFVRHKILDIFGTIALAGVRFEKTGFLYAQGEHKFEFESLRELIKRQIFQEIFT